MPATIDGQTYYRTAEACRMVGITKNTFLRWVREKSFPDVKHRDRRGWRLFTEEEVERLREEVNHINIALPACFNEVSSLCSSNIARDQLQV